MDISKVYETFQSGYKGFYLLYGTFVSNMRYPISFNFFKDNKYNGLLEYFAFEQRNCLLMRNYVLADRYKNKISDVLKSLYSEKMNKDILLSSEFV